MLDCIEVGQNIRKYLSYHTNRDTNFSVRHKEVCLTTDTVFVIPLQWRHNGHDGFSNHQPHDCLLSRLFRHRSKKTSKLRVTGLCAGYSPGTGEFPAQRASNAENSSIWWRHHAKKQIWICIRFQEEMEITNAFQTSTTKILKSKPVISRFLSFWKEASLLFTVFWMCKIQILTNAGAAVVLFTWKAQSCSGQWRPHSKQTLSPWSKARGQLPVTWEAWQHVVI